MIRYVLAVALLVAASCAPAWAGEPVTKTDAAYGVRYVQERVVTLPQDQNKPYLTLFGERDDPKLRTMEQWFETDEILAGLKNQTHYNVIYTDTAMYRDRYANTMPALPCVRLQAVGEDQPVAEFAGVNIPMTADSLAKGLNTRARAAECFRRRNRCQPRPQPFNPQPPLVDPPPQPLLPPSPLPTPRGRVPWLLLGVLATVGGVLGAAKHLRDVYYGRKL